MPQKSLSIQKFFTFETDLGGCFGGLVKCVNLLRRRLLIESLLNRMNRFCHNWLRWEGGYEVRHLLEISRNG